MDNNSDKLREQFTAKWTGSKRGFARINGLNPVSFSQWLAGKKESKICDKAVIEYLNNETTDNKIDNTADKPFINIKIHALLDKLTNQVGLKKIIFLYANDCVPELFALNYDKFTRILTDSVHVVIIITKNVIISDLTFKIATANAHNWISILRTKTNCKDATSVMLTVVISFLNLKLDQEISFTIVSKCRDFTEIIYAANTVTDRKIDVMSVDEINNIINM